MLFILSRGIIAGLGPFFVSSGITFVYTLGSILPWRWVCLVCAALPSAVIIAMPFLPETPNWLVHNGKIAQAEKVSGGQFLQEIIFYCCLVFIFSAVARGQTGDVMDK